MTPDPKDFPDAIFENTSAYGLMEHADELRRWVREGGELREYDGDVWKQFGCIFWHGNCVYRAVRPALIPFSVPDEVWRVLDPRWKFAARDKDGGVYLYVIEPLPGEVVWSFRGITYRKITDLFPAIVVGTVPWTEAIVKRPEGL